MNNDEQHLNELLRILRQRLNVIEEKTAYFGQANTPSYLLMERDEVNVEIAQTEQKLRIQTSNPSSRPPQPSWALPIGAQVGAGGTLFRVWAPTAQHVSVILYDSNDASTSSHMLAPQAKGYFKEYIPSAYPGMRYQYQLDDRGPFPDPASRYQPEGVHGPSQIVDPTVFDWTDQNWRGITLDDLIIYELHVGTATEEGTFDSLITRLGAIRDLGATAIEIMPVADFPGKRNWGYDGVCLFAPAQVYGGPEALRRLVDAAHARGLAVILDAVFNHLGPDGNNLGEFSKAYFNPDPEFRTPWGPALNFDGKSSGPVRDFFVANACYWAREYHVDGLRIDALHAIQDDKIPHILAEISRRVRKELAPNRSFLIIAEDENNDPDIVKSLDDGGLDIDALWADDFRS